jgi:hypothetical protein
MKGLEFLGLSANKLNTFHENTCFFKSRSVPSIRIAVSESDGTLLYDRTSVLCEGQKRNLLSGSNV